MSKRTIIKNAQVALPGGAIEHTSVAFEGGTIVGIDHTMRVSADEVIDASGKLLMPGVVDDQVHFREPGFTHKEDLRSATRAAISGGVTSFLEMPNTDPTTTTVERLHEKLALARTRCFANFGFYIGATPDNVDELRRAERTPGIKIFIGSSTGSLLVDQQDALEAIFERTTLPICAHCEDEAIRAENRARVDAEAAAAGRPLTHADHRRIRDHACALASTKRAIDLAARHRHPFHVLHVTTAQEIEFLRDRPEWVTAEACWPHLAFTDADDEALGSHIQVNPSVKTAADRDAIWRGLHEGVLTVVATDHAPHTLEEKSRPYPDSPSGMPAIELSLPLMLNEVHAGRVTMAELLAWMCENPAKIWSLKNKGRIAEGADADLVLVDPELSRTVRNEDQHSKCGWTPFRGRTLTGWPVRTWVMGKTAFNEGAFADEPTGREIEYDRE